MTKDEFLQSAEVPPEKDDFTPPTKAEQFQRYFGIEDPSLVRLPTVDELTARKVADARSSMEELGVGLKRGYDQTMGTGAATLGLIGKAIGIEPMAQMGMDAYTAYMEDAAKNQAAIPDPLSDIHSVSDGTKYLIGLVGEQMPNILSSVVGAGVGTFTGKKLAQTLVTKAIREEAEKLAVAGVAEDVAQAQAEKIVQRNMIRAIGKGGLEKATNWAEIAGSQAGMLPVNMAGEVGSIGGDIYDKTGQIDPGTAFAYGVPAGLMEGLGEGVEIAPFMRAFKPGEKVSKLVSKQFLKDTGKAVGLSMGTEAGTEYAQTWLEQLGLYHADPRENPFTAEKAHERALAATAGAAIGGLVSGGGSVFSGSLAHLDDNKASLTKQALEQKIATKSAASVPTASKILGPEEGTKGEPLDFKIADDTNTTAEKAYGGVPGVYDAFANVTQVKGLEKMTPEELTSSLEQLHHELVTAPDREGRKAAHEALNLVRAEIKRRETAPPPPAETKTQEEVPYPTAEQTYGGATNIYDAFSNVKPAEKGGVPNGEVQTEEGKKDEVATPAPVSVASREDIQALLPGKKSWPLPNGGLLSPTMGYGDLLLFIDAAKEKGWMASKPLSKAGGVYTAELNPIAVDESKGSVAPVAKAPEAPAPVAAPKAPDEIGDAARSMSFEDFYAWAKKEQFGFADNKTMASLIYKSKLAEAPVAATEQQVIPAVFNDFGQSTNEPPNGTHRLYGTFDSFEHLWVPKDWTDSQAEEYIVNARIAAAKQEWVDRGMPSAETFKKLCQEYLEKNGKRSFSGSSPADKAILNLDRIDEARRYAGGFREHLDRSIDSATNDSVKNALTWFRDRFNEEEPAKTPEVAKAPEARNLMGDYSESSLVHELSLPDGPVNEQGSRVVFVPLEDSEHPHFPDLDHNKFEITVVPDGLEITLKPESVEVSENTHLKATTEQSMLEKAKVDKEKELREENPDISKEELENALADVEISRTPKPAPLKAGWDKRNGLAPGGKFSEPVPGEKGQLATSVTIITSDVDALHKNILLMAENDPVLADTIQDDLRDAAIAKFLREYRKHKSTPGSTRPSEGVIVNSLLRDLGRAYALRRELFGKTGRTEYSDETHVHEEKNSSERLPSSQDDHKIPVDKAIAWLKTQVERLPSGSTLRKKTEQLISHYENGNSISQTELRSRLAAVRRLSESTGSDGESGADDGRQGAGGTDKSVPSREPEAVPVRSSSPSVPKAASGGSERGASSGQTGGGTPPTRPNAGGATRQVGGRQPAATRTGAGNPDGEATGGRSEGSQPQPAGARTGHIVLGASFLEQAPIRVSPDAYSTGPGKVTLDKGQVDGVNQLLSGIFDKNFKGLALADGPGEGKTMALLSIVDQYQKASDKPVLILAPSAPILSRFRADAKAMGVDLNRVVLATYAKMAKGAFDGKEFGIVIADEAHSLKNSESSRSSQFSKLKTDHEILSTATMFDTPEGAAYALSVLSDGTMSEAAVLDRVGVEMVPLKRGGKVVIDSTTEEPKMIPKLKADHTWEDVNNELEKMRDEALERGAMVRRYTPFFGEVRVENRTMPAQAKAEQAKIIAYFDKEIRDNPSKKTSIENVRNNALTAHSEMMKEDWVMEQIKDALAQGRKPIVMAENANPRVIRGLGMRDALLGRLVERLKAEGISFAKIYGENVPDREKDAARFQRGEVDVALGTPNAAGAGIDLDDQRGDAPRTMVLPTVNYAGDMYDQIQGRISRRNTKSASRVVFLNYSDSAIDQKHLDVASKKLSTLRAIQGGTDADAAMLKESADKAVDTAGGRKRLRAVTPEQARRREDNLADYPDERLARQIPTKAVQAEWTRRGVFPKSMVVEPSAKDQMTLARLLKVIRANRGTEVADKATEKFKDIADYLPTDDRHAFIKIGNEVFDLEDYSSVGSASKIKSFGDIKAGRLDARVTTTQANAPREHVTRAAREVREMSSVPIKFDTEDEGAAYVYTDEGVPKHIYINPEVLAKATRNMSDSERRGYIASVVAHERLHIEDLQNLHDDFEKISGRKPTNEELSALHDLNAEEGHAKLSATEAGRELLQQVADDYGVTEPAAAYAELKRMLAQRVLSGETNEEMLRRVRNSGDLGLIGYVRRFIEAIKRMLTKAPGLREAVLQAERDLDAAMGDAKVEPSPASSSGGKLYAKAPKEEPVYKEGGLFHAAGKFNERTFDRYLRMQQAKAMHSERAVHASNLLKQAVQKDFVNRKIATPETAIQIALGSADNHLTEEQQADYEKLRRRKDAPIEGMDDAMAEGYRAAMMDQNREELKIQQAAALASLPDATRKAIENMRQLIDEQSQTGINKGAFAGELAKTVEANKGVYQHRGYAIFGDTEAWLKKINEQKDPVTRQIVSDMYQYVFNQAVAIKAREMIRESKEQGVAIPRDMALKLAEKDANGNINPETAAFASNLMESYAGVGDHGIESMITGRLPGQKDMSIAKLRGQIPEVIRRYWGEYTDPVANFVNTYTSISSYIANHEFLQGVKDIGTSEGWIHDPATGAHPAGWVRFAGSRKNMGPLADMYGPKALAEAFASLNTHKEINWFTRALSGLTGAAALSKTALSVQSGVRNFMGNMLPSMANGNFFRVLVNPRDLQDARGVAFSNKEKYQQMKEEAVLLGLKGQSVEARFTRDLLDKGLGNDPSGNRFIEATKKLFHGMTSTYGGMDDFWKVVNYRGELSKISNLTTDQVRSEAARLGIDLDGVEDSMAHKKFAAEIVRNTTPSYDLAWSVNQKVFKKIPIFGPFLTFTLETLRTAANISKYAYARTRSPKLP